MLEAQKGIIDIQDSRFEPVSSNTHFDKVREVVFQ